MTDARDYPEAYQDGDYDEQGGEAGWVIASLRQQLAERDVVIKDFAQIERGMEQQLAECQKQIDCFEPVEFNALKRQWQREALLEAIRAWELSPDTLLVSIVRRMAKELE